MKMICGWCEYYSNACNLCKKYNLDVSSYTKRNIIACAGYRKHHAYK